MFKLYRILFYPLSIVFSFLLGILVAKLVGAGEGQMLAAGAIILSYGVIGAVIGFVLSIILGNNIQKSALVKLNIALVLLIIACFLYFYLTKR